VWVVLERDPVADADVRAVLETEMGWPVSKDLVIVEPEETAKVDDEVARDGDAGIWRETVADLGVDDVMLRDSDDDAALVVEGTIV